MGQIGSWFAPQFPDALIVSIGGVEPCGPNGRQWFRCRVTEENRQQRIDAIMPTFIEIVRYWQERRHQSTATALIGFSQGRSCRWKASKQRRIWLRGRSRLFNGRYAAAAGLPATAAATIFTRSRRRR